MAIHSLLLPHQVEPALRMVVDTRHVGPMLAALHRQRGFQFVVETDARGETAAWLVRAARGVMKAR